MPNVALHPGATVFVTGVNGLIGSHIADQLLRRGYHVRGGVRDTAKNKWLVDYFIAKYKGAKFELVEVPNMTVEGCYDGLVDGTSLRFREWEESIGANGSVTLAEVRLRQAHHHWLIAITRS